MKILVSLSVKTWTPHSIKLRTLYGGCNNKYIKENILSNAELQTYEMYGERNTEPDANALENAKREKEKTVKLGKIKEKLKLRRFIVIESSPDFHYYGTSVPYREQERTYWCGPATGLQTLENWDREDEIADDPDDRQAQLADDMDTTKDGTSIYKCRDAINEYLPNDYYVSKKIKNTSDSKEDLKENTIADLDLDHSVVYLVIKNYLSYYEGTSSSGHYISGKEYFDYHSYSDDEIGLMDCHYDNDYAGSHYEPFLKVHKALYKYYESRSVANFLW